MNESSLDQEKNKSTFQPKLFGLSHPLVGALIGTLLVSIIGLLFWSAGYNARAMAFLYPGYLALSAIEYLPPFLAFILFFPELIVFGISSIPPAIIGSLVISNNKKSRIIGVIILVVYIIFWMYVSLIFLLMSN